MVERRPFTLRFAHGGTLALGERTAVMGVLNVTPDSFSDGGRYADPARAIEAGEALAAAGAEIVDVGGESTRPGAEPVAAEVEAARVLPVIAGLRARAAVRISIDTTKAAVARAALDAGADLVNDVSALADPAMLALLAERGAPVVLMHGRPASRTTQAERAPGNLVVDVTGLLRRRIAQAVGAGLDDGKILVDPGVGFGKAASGSLSILRHLPALANLGRPILVGASRKSFIGAALGLPAGERLEASLAVAAWAAAEGAHVVRVHDVEPTLRVVRMIDALRAAA